MQKTLLIVFGLFFLLLTTSFAQRPPKVHSIVKQLNTFEWYKNAARDWAEVLKQNPKDADAWLNYYTANRMIKMMFPEEYSKVSEPYLEDLDLIVMEAGENIEETFELYYLKIYNDRTFNEEFEMNMLKAYELGGNRPEILDDLAGFYETRRDSKKTSLFFRLWFESEDMSPGILNWNYNVINSLEKQSILITNGDNDTYPPIMLQQIMGVRKDVLVLNISLLTLDGYRGRIFEEYELGNPEIDYESFRDPETFTLDIQKEIIRKIISGSVNRNLNVYFAVTLLQDLFEEFKDKIYITGLAYKYSEAETDYLPLLAENYKNNWLLDYLKITFRNDISIGIVNKLNMNYLPVFSILYNHYMSLNDEKEANKIKGLAHTIAEQNSALEYYRSLFESEK